MILLQLFLIFITQILMRKILFHTFHSQLLDVIEVRFEHFAWQQIIRKHSIASNPL